MKKVVLAWVPTDGPRWWQWTERVERQKMAATAVATPVIVLAGVDGIRGAMDTADCMARIRGCASQRRQAKDRSAAKWPAWLCLPSRPQALDITLDSNSSHYYCSTANYKHTHTSTHCIHKESCMLARRTA